MRSLLKDVFGLTELRPGQRAVIDSVLSRRHTLAIMPTGAGKSLCYQVPAMLLPGRTVVVSPLIALMRDQYDKLTQLGIPAVQFNSAVPADEARTARVQIGRRQVEFVFVTPEQLTSEDVRRLLASADVDLIVFDEAHCVSQWGHDFRPAYLDAVKVVRGLGAPTVLCLTATAPPAVVTDLEAQLGLGPLAVINTGLQRPNLRYSVRHADGDEAKQRQLLALLADRDGAGIVYAASIRHVNEITTWLRGHGMEVVSYHGKLSARARSDAQDAFMSGRSNLVVATNAFGMGIDRPDIRHVVHYDLPASLDVYYQESGRAGRDGAAAECVLLFNRSDRALQAFFMAGRYPGLAEFTAVGDLLERMDPGTPTSLAALGESLPGVAAGKLRVIVNVLKASKVLRGHRSGRLELRSPPSPALVATLAARYEERREQDRLKLEQMIVYGQTALCRTKLLLEALGEQPPGDSCDQCDNCRGHAERAAAPAEGAA